MKTIDDALELRGRIFGAFEMAEREPDPQLRAMWLTFVVVGAGATGVELTGQIVELARVAAPQPPAYRSRGVADRAAGHRRDDPPPLP
jgi:NADH:ubiquinone reductase (H+-translocating)